MEISKDVIRDAIHFRSIIWRNSSTRPRMRLNSRPAQLATRLAPCLNKVGHCISEHFRTVSAKSLFPIFILLLSQPAPTLSINNSNDLPNQDRKFSLQRRQKRAGKIRHESFRKYAYSPTLPSKVDR